MENARDLSSSPGLSTPPKSPSSPSSGEAIVVQPKAVLYPDLNKSPTQKSGTLKSTKPHGAGAGGEQSAPKQVRKRAPKTDKKKEGGDAAPKQRKPRAKKQKDHDPASLSATASKLSAAAAGQTSALKKIQSTVQPLISEALFSAPHIPSTHSGGKDGPTNPVPFPIGNKNEAIQKSVKSEPLAPTFVSPPPQIQMLSQSTSTSRGQNYDPIRSSTIEIPRPIQISNPVTSAQTSPVKTAGRASASPSIASLINPPATQNVPSASRPSSSSASASLRISPQQHAFVPQPHKSAASIDSPRSVPPIPTPTVKPPTPPAQASALPPTAMDIDSDAPAKPIKSNTSHKPSISTNNSSTAPSPKQPGTKSRNSGGTPTLPPLPGTGFLSGSSLFSNNSGNASNESGTSGQTIIIDVPLNSEGNKYINYARLVEEKYGRDALFPKQKAQRDRMARVAAVGAALENARKTNGVSADEMSLDVSDNEGEQSNADKKGSEADDGAPKKRKRTMKEDQYDKDDPFVDDTELAWEEQAAAVKDGFFVYRGPLVQPGDRPDIERYADPQPFIHLASTDIFSQCKWHQATHYPRPRARPRRRSRLTRRSGLSRRRRRKRTRCGCRCCCRRRCDGRHS